MSVFKFIKENCAQKETGIGKAELDALMQKYLVQMSQKMGRYYDSNSRCYSSINASGAIFNMRRLAHILLHEWMSEVVKKNFQSQTKDGSKSWSMFFSHALMNFANDNVGVDLSKNISKRYNILAFTISEKLSISALLYDEDIINILKDFVRNYRPVLKNGEAMNQLSYFVNKELDERLNNHGANRLNVSNKEMERFFQMLLARC